MPRAAMSVATRMRKRPLLKPASAAVRWAWLRLPWMRSQATLWRTRKSASRLARCLVRVKTSALFISPRLSSSSSSEDFTSWATGYTAWVMPTAGAAVRSRLMVAGLRSSSRVRATMGGGMVAEKNSVWLRGGQVLEHAADVGEEAHVEHAVGFVEHENLEPFELRVGVAEVIEQPSRRGHDDVDAAPEGVLLRSHAHAAEHRGARHGRVHGQSGSGARRSARPARASGVRISARVMPRRLAHEPVEDGQHEGRRLAAARHGAGEDVAAFHGGRNRVLLDRGGTSEAHLLDAAEEIGV